MGLLERIESKSFLGEEFLTWLLWRSDQRNGLIGVGEIEVHFGSSLALSAPFGEAEEVALRGDNPAGSPELVTALREGKLVTKAHMRWVIGGIEWNLSLRGDTMALGGLKPPLRSAPADAEWIERRLELLEEFARAFDGVFDAFLEIRLSERAWRREVASMREWVAREPSPRTTPTSEYLPEIIEVTDPEAR